MTENNLAQAIDPFEAEIAALEAMTTPDHDLGYPPEHMVTRSRVPAPLVATPVSPERAQHTPLATSARRRVWLGYDRTETPETPEHRLEALRGLHQRRHDHSPAAYKAAFSAAGFQTLDGWAIDYLAKRTVAPKVAAAPVSDPDREPHVPRYQTGFGALPRLPRGVGKWTRSQQEWALGEEAEHSWLLIYWTDANNAIIGAQIRWEVPRAEVDSEGTVRLHKFDFPVDRETGKFDRLVDAQHASPRHDVVIIIESPVRADSLRSLLPEWCCDVSILAVGGITMAYEGRSNSNNPSDVFPRLAPAVLSLTGGLAGKTVLWAPDADHRTNPACNRATQYTIESVLDAGAAGVYVVDVPGEVVHPRSGRVQPLDAGAGLDDLAAAMEEVQPGTQWLGSLLAESIKGTEYIAMYPDVELDAQGLAEATADALTREGTHKYIATTDNRGVYFHYRGGYWAIDTADAAATVVATGCANRVFDKGGKEATKKARKRARSDIETAARRAPRTETGISHLIVQGPEWEPREWSDYIPTPDGLLDPRNLTVFPHTPQAMNLGVTTVGYVPGAQNDDWNRFRRDFFVSKETDEDGRVVRGADGEPVWVHDADKELMMQEFAGAALMSSTFDACLWIVGGGGAGISTLVGTCIGGLLPPEYKGSLSSSELAGGGGEFILSGIVNARLAEVNEFGQKDMLDVVLYKQIFQDGSEMVVNPKFGAKYQASPTATGILTTNDLPALPKSAGNNNSFPRRTYLLAAERIFKIEDKDLAKRLRTREAREAIMAWAVEGAHRFLVEGNGKPWRSPESEQMLNAWLANADRLGDFIGECLIESPASHVTVDEMFKAYWEYCTDSQVAEAYRKTKQTLTADLSARPKFGPHDRAGNRKSDGRRGWQGWAIIPKDERNEF